MVRRFREEVSNEAELDSTDRNDTELDEDFDWSAEDGFASEE